MLQKIHDSIRWWAVLILGLIAVSFVFWGIDFNLTGATFAAKVNGEEIRLDEFERAVQIEQSQYQRLYRTEIDDDMRRQIRRNVLQDMVRTEALEQRVQEQGYRASNERVTESIQTMPVFQINGNFSYDLYRSRLANEGMSPRQFEELQRQQLALLDLQTGIANSAFLTPAEFRRYIELYNQRRELGYALFEVAAFMDDVAVTDEEITAYYEANRDRYMTEESVDLEYIELSQADVAADVEVTDEEVRQYYEEQRDRFQTQEERRARHILITAEEGEEEAARATAESVVQRAQAGEDFAALARELSQDPGTKEAGGDLGWISRGMLEGPFEDALYDMQEGEIRGPVQTDFGFHVIKLEEIREGEVQPFEAVADTLRTELRTQRAEDLFYDRANELGDRAFEAYDEGLAGVADELGLELKTRPGFPRTGDRELFGDSNAAVVQAAFSEEVLEEGQNSSLVELADDHVLVLRVTAHHLPELKPLEEVRAQVEEELKRERAADKAAEAATAFLAALEEEGGAASEPASDAAADDSGAAAEASEAEEAADAEGASDDEEGSGAEEASPAAALAAMHGGTWHAPTWVERTSAEVPTEILAAAFQVPSPPAGEPLRDRVSLASGDQAVVVLSGVRAGAPEDVPRAQRDRQIEQLEQQMALAEISAYAANVTDAATVRIPEEVLEPRF